MSSTVFTGVGLCVNYLGWQQLLPNGSESGIRRKQISPEYRISTRIAAGGIMGEVDSCSDLARIIALYELRPPLSSGNELVRLTLLWLLQSLCGLLACAAGEPMELHVVDATTGRGIPLVELITVDDVIYVTDSAGRVALDEPAFEGQTIFFRLRSPGYRGARDGFGIEGVRVVVRSGGMQEIRLERQNVAERLYRVTGRDIYRDSLLLKREVPFVNSPGAGLVVGQDSVQTAIYQGRMYWFWGDTNRLSYPLGLFRTAGAVSGLPGGGGLQPATSIGLEYFVGQDGFARAMVRLAEPEGVVWIEGVSVIPDAAGVERLVCSYSRRRGLETPLEQGHLLWNDKDEVFEKLSELPLDETWRLLRGHPYREVMDGREYLVCGHPFPTVRVPARLESLLDGGSWESWTCGEGTERSKVAGAAMPAEAKPPQLRPVRTPGGDLSWAWRASPPVTQQDEDRWLREGLVSAEELRFLPEDAEQDGRRVLLHGGTVRWNAWRGRWVLIGNAQEWDRGAASFLGEVFYSEADSPRGPFRKALKIATHPGQSFYNPCHHGEFDEDGGRRIYFEGTYTNMFTSSTATPRYNYNQLMYGMDLNDGRISRVFGGRENQQRP